MPKLPTRRREVRVALTGTLASGKTVFLTSLIWHLRHHNPESFRLGRGVEIRGVRERRGGSMPFGSFPWEAHRQALNDNAEWPEKTAASQLYCCELELAGGGRRFGKRIGLELLDFPGERVGDAEMLGVDYAHWSERVLTHIRHKQSRHRAPEFLGLLEEGGDPDAAGPTAEALLEGYKQYLGRALQEDCARMLTPSTFFVDEQGVSLTQVAGGPGEWAALRCSGLAGAEFVPLPKAFADRDPGLYRQFRRHYRRYKREVVGPLFQRIIGSDVLVMLVDVPGMLMNGPVSYGDEQQLIEYMLGAVNPVNRLWRLLPWRHRLRRLALVATKADMVDPDDRDRLKGLLQELTEPGLRQLGRGVVMKRFTCSAIKSTRPLGHHRLEIRLPGEAGGQVEQVAVSALPRRWPEEERWPDFVFRESLPRVSSRRDVPPPQVGLDQVCGFMLQRKERRSHG